MGANYDARPCADERKAAGAGTMGINGKTMQRTMETMKNTMGATTSGCRVGRQAMGLRALVAGRTGFVCRIVEEACGAIRKFNNWERRARTKSRPDARLPLCTNCHAPFAPEMQAVFRLSPLFMGANAPDAAARCPAAFWQNEAKPKTRANSASCGSSRCSLGCGRRLQLHPLVHQALQRRVVDLAGAEQRQLLDGQHLRRRPSLGGV